MAKDYCQAWIKLLQYEVDCNSQDHDGNTALHLALFNWTARPAGVKEWVKGGANVNINNRLGQTCVFNLQVANDLPGIDEYLDILIDAGIDLEKQDYLGRTAVLHFAQKGESGIITKLQQHGANMSVKDFQGKTGLHIITHAELFSVDSGVRIIGLFTKGGLTPKAVDYTGSTPLHDAVEATMPIYGVLESLVKSEVNPTIRNHQGRSMWQGTMKARHCCMPLLVGKRRI